MKRNILIALLIMLMASFASAETLTVYAQKNDSPFVNFSITPYNPQMAENDQKLNLSSSFQASVPIPAFTWTMVGNADSSVGLSITVTNFYSTAKTSSRIRPTSSGTRTYYYLSLNTLMELGLSSTQSGDGFTLTSAGSHEWPADYNSSSNTSLKLPFTFTYQGSSNAGNALWTRTGTLSVAAKNFWVTNNATYDQAITSLEYRSDVTISLTGI